MASLRLRAPVVHAEPLVHQLPAASDLEAFDEVTAEVQVHFYRLLVQTSGDRACHCSGCKPTPSSSRCDWLLNSELLCSRALYADLRGMGLAGLRG
eukprot:14864732-Alexandrium_andersonii.AAC.1